VDVIPDNVMQSGVKGPKDCAGGIISDDCRWKMSFSLSDVELDTFDPPLFIPEGFYFEGRINLFGIEGLFQLKLKGFTGRSPAMLLRVALMNPIDIGGWIVIRGKKEGTLLQQSQSTSFLETDENGAIYELDEAAPDPYACAFVDQHRAVGRHLRDKKEFAEKMRYHQARRHMFEKSVLGSNKTTLVQKKMGQEPIGPSFMVKVDLYSGSFEMETMSYLRIGNGEILEGGIFLRVATAEVIIKMSHGRFFNLVEGACELNMGVSMTAGARFYLAVHMKLAQILQPIMLLKSAIVSTLRGLNQQIRNWVSKLNGYNFLEEMQEKAKTRIIKRRKAKLQKEEPDRIGDGGKEDWGSFWFEESGENPDEWSSDDTIPEWENWKKRFISGLGTKEGGGGPIEEADVIAEVKRDPTLWEELCGLFMELMDEGDRVLDLLDGLTIYEGGFAFGGMNFQEILQNGVSTYVGYVFDGKRHRLDMILRFNANGFNDLIDQVWNGSGGQLAKFVGDLVSKLASIVIRAGIAIAKHAAKAALQVAKDVAKNAAKVAKNAAKAAAGAVGRVFNPRNWG